MSASTSQRRLTKHPPSQQQRHANLPDSNPSKTTKDLKHKEAGSSTTEATSSFRRPSPPPRSSSFYKRHASFDTPREIPLPSPQAQQPSSTNPYFPPVPPKTEPGLLTKPRPTSLSHATTERSFAPVFDEEVVEDGWTNVSTVNPDKQSTGDGVRRSSPSTLRHQLEPPYQQPSSSALTLTVTPSPIHPFPRPYSVPHSNSHDSSITNNTSSSSNSTSSSPPPRLSPGAVDRSSSASLPLPSQIPYHTLPKVGAIPPIDQKLGASDLVSDVAKSRTDEAEEDLMQQQQANEFSVSRKPFMSPTHSSRNFREATDKTVNSGDERPRASFDRDRPLRDPPKTARFEPNYSDGKPTFYGAATALRRSVASIASSSLPPPEPPTILPSPSIPMEPTWSLHSTSSKASSSPESITSSNYNSSVATDITTPDSESVSGSSSPGKLEPAPQSPIAQRFAASVSSMISEPAAPPYAPFLSHEPAPADTWIEVETLVIEYRLNVNLPNFSRDGITLATKRRRILHIVADSWGNGGGHFERRISFGYDADLTQVRAEFDGQMLRVIVPRKMPSIMLDVGTGMGMGYSPM